MMNIAIPQKIVAFAATQPGEEAVWQPRYHIQSMAAAAVTSLAFFGTTVSQAAGGIRDTNMEKSNAIANPKRLLVEAVGVDFEPGVQPSQTETGAAYLNTYVNDKNAVLSVGAFQLKLIDSFYLTLAPLTRLPAGKGLNISGAAVAFTLAVAANRSASIGYATNGLPTPHGLHWLKIPLPLQSETFFEGQVSWTTAPSLSIAGRLEVRLEGLEIRPAVVG